MDLIVFGAGAVVVRDLPSDCTAVGVPAAVIKQAQLSSSQPSCTKSP